MNIRPLGYLVLMLAVMPVAFAEQPENAQAKALREQIEREAAARKAENDALIAADIARNPDGANAQAARKAAEAEKAQALEKQTAEEKAKADAEASAKAAAEKDAQERKEAAARWEAGAPERARAAAAQKAAVEKWRASGKPGPSIMMSKRADGTVTVMVDGNVTTFQTVAEAEAFVEKVRSKTDSALSY
jgi:hypothetical protein